MTIERKGPKKGCTSVLKQALKRIRFDANADANRADICRHSANF